MHRHESVPDSRFTRAPVCGGSCGFWLLAAMGAAGMFFGQPNNWLHFPPLVLLYPFALYLTALRAPTAKDRLLRCFTLGLAAHCATLYWLVHPMHDVAAVPYIGAAACVGLLSCYLALFSALAGLGMRGLWDMAILISSRGASSGYLPQILAALLAGFVYGGFEVLNGWLFTGFPWVSLSSAFAFLPAWVQTASITGSYGLSALYASAASLAALAWVTSAFRLRLVAGILGLVLCLAQPLYGVYRLSGPEPEPAGPEVNILMVQGNIDQNQKWEPAFQKGTLDLYLELTARALADYGKDHIGQTGPTLVLWPETALPFYFQLHKEYADEVYRFALRHKLNIMFGTLGIGDDGSGMNALYNRLYLVSFRGGISGWYDKKHLVPFGEYIPFAADIAFLRNLLQGMDFSSGIHTESLQLEVPPAPRDPLADAPLPPQINGDPQVFSHKDRLPGQMFSLGALICYEAIFPYLAQQRVAEGANILVNVSNDAWFRRSSAPLQHLALTAMRAVEQARPIVRCTNTGISAIIDARGRIAAYVDKMFVADSFRGAVVPSREKTLFHRMFPAQDYFLIIMAIFSFLCHISIKIRHIS